MAFKKYVAVLGAVGTLYSVSASAQGRAMDPARTSGDLSEVVLDDSPSFISSGFESNSLLALQEEGSKICLNEAEITINSRSHPEFNRAYRLNDLALSFVDRDAGERDEVNLVRFSDDACVDVPETMKDGEGYFVAHLHVKPGVVRGVQRNTVARLAEVYRAPL